MRRAVALSFVLALAIAPACSTSPPLTEGPRRDCAHTVWYAPLSPLAKVEVVGSWNGWSRPGIELTPVRDGWRAARLELPKGPHQYAILDDGAWLTDPRVPASAEHEGHEVSWLDHPDCERPGLRVEQAHGSADGAAAFTVTFVAAADGAALDPASVRAVSRGGLSLPPSSFSIDSVRGIVTANAAGLPAGKHVFTVTAKDTTGREADDARATVWIEPRSFDLRDAVVYQVIVDRYRGKGGSSLAAPSPASARAGGQIEGLRRAIEAGELTRLGVNAVWVLPLYKNPTGMFPGLDGQMYSSYHGYWPVDSRAIEPALGDEAAVDALVAAAHTRGIRVILDVVPNHVHEQHPYVAQHRDQGWFNQVGGQCICGRSCDWGEHILDCWFTTYLWDLDWRNPAVADQVSGDVEFWFDRFDVDGVRVDAVPMMPRSAIRRIAHTVRRRHDHPGARSYLLGENFTGEDGYASIRYALGPYGLDGQFHFPLIWALRNSIASATAPMTVIDDAVTTGERAWAGAGAVMGLTIGNHDMVRFATQSAGDAQSDGWTPATQPADPLVYAKQQMALAIPFTLPGAPIVYYGDELALVGRGDPDSRRVMPSEGELLEPQRQTRAKVERLGRARACSAALRRGTYRKLYASGEVLIYARELPPGTSPDGAGDGAPAVVVLQRSVTGSLSVPLPGIPGGDWVDVLTGARSSLSPELTNLPGEPFSVRVFFPAASACHGGG